MSSRLDETDSLVVFDDVFVPWEDVFIYKNIELTAGQFSVTAAHVLGNTQSHIRSWAKLQFLVGLVKRCMDLSGRSTNSEMIGQLGDLATRVSLVEGMILGAEAAALAEEVGQGPLLGQHPGVHGLDELVAGDEVVLQRQDAEEQVAVDVGLGHRERS